MPARPARSDAHLPRATEGVIHFRAVHHHAPLASLERAAARALLGWRALLFRLDLLGKDAARYDGAAYGNVSARVGPFPGERGARPFVVSCTQTSAPPAVSVDDFCVVSRWSLADNTVHSRGPCLPSSESMTHGAIYDLSPAIRAVLHVHTPELWRRAGTLPTTAAHIGYGTPDMAAEMARLWRTTALPDVRVLSMGGHQDGVVAFGATVDDAAAALLGALAGALVEGDRSDGGARCR